MIKGDYVYIVSSNPETPDMPKVIYVGKLESDPSDTEKIEITDVLYLDIQEKAIRKPHRVTLFRTEKFNYEFFEHPEDLELLTSKYIVSIQDGDEKRSIMNLIGKYFEQALR